MRSQNSLAILIEIAGQHVLWLGGVSNLLLQLVRLHVGPRSACSQRYSNLSSAKARIQGHDGKAGQVLAQSGNSIKAKMLMDSLYIPQRKRKHLRSGPCCIVAMGLLARRGLRTGRQISIFAEVQKAGSGRGGRPARWGRWSL